MPLSDREQQILSDIEAQLREEDPKFAQTVSGATVAAHARRHVKFAVALFLVGFGLLLAFIVSFWFGVAGFAVMLVSAVYGGHHLRRLSQGSQGSQSGGIGRYFNGPPRGRDDQHR